MISEDLEKYPVLDETVAEQLRARALKGRNLYDYTLEIFASEAPNCMHLIEQAFQENNTEELREQAHVFKGICATLGAKRLWKLADDLLHPQESGTAAGSALLETMKAELQRFTEVAKAGSAR